MTLGGEYGTRNYTIKHLQSSKGKTVLTETMPFTTSEASAAEEAGIDTPKVKFARLDGPLNATQDDLGSS